MVWLKTLEKRCSFCVCLESVQDRLLEELGVVLPDKELYVLVDSLLLFQVEIHLQTRGMEPERLFVVSLGEQVVIVKSLVVLLVGPAELEHHILTHGTVGHIALQVLLVLVFHQH